MLCAQRRGGATHHQALGEQQQALAQRRVPRHALHGYDAQAIRPERLRRRGAGPDTCAPGRLDVPNICVFALSSRAAQRARTRSMSWDKSPREESSRSL